MDVFAQDRTAQRALRQGLAQIVCLERHTLTGLLGAAGRQHHDWSAEYRLHSQSPWDPQALFGPVLSGTLDLLPPHAPVVAAMDDTALRKTGRHAADPGWKRDPLSPKFHCNFIRGQRFLQVSVLLPAGPPPIGARALPIHFQHVPPVPKPKKTDPQEVWQAYRQRQRQDNLSTRGAAAIAKLREDLDQRPQGQERLLVIGGDGSFTNSRVLRRLPQRTALIGRIRKDAKLYRPPPPPDPSQPGRHRRYGQRLPTPEDLLKDPTIPWQEVQAYAAGKVHTFRVKTVAPVLWKEAGPDLPLRLVVIAPVGYRLRARDRLLYRQPAFLICTDVNLPLQGVVQYYVWRWEIEVNHRDEKQLIGVGEAQVWNEHSVDRQPVLGVASYSLLLLAGAQAYGPDASERLLPPPKWLEHHPHRRVTTQDLIQALRNEVWSYGISQIQMNFNGFVIAPAPDAKPSKCLPLPAPVVPYGATST
jgi:hypothetical protein